ncbi:hypothetical protein AGABI2DRAFT_123088 [Agaricus bisporus var. bisporus H97]|uniref:hypothetical protein n=1 Tax=Agaricus bisporus var. bisporus (strain H97 / ATCC MYA-4626 / FGSC 10389) TaxID=936046 RepID=UPI00029F5F28|nr:hypothetical protein AGABI2DRAFT_123088 [Agaricus bisporus var. bisporus H97]EKV41968.1 hypothetical protein AGABI2DRAFT_123088 [Agaricus bisporus var. bisporus H97]
MSSPCLPQELVDTVIDHLHADRAALAACALVCQSWLHTSRQHLFATISLSTLSQSRIPPNILCARLYGILKADPGLIKHIRNLQILDGGSSRSGHWIIEETTLPSLLKLLTNLKQLEFGATDTTNTLQIKSLPFPWQNALCTVLKLPTMTYFRIQHSIFPNLALLESILSSCHHLKALSLCSVTVDEDLSRGPSISLPVSLLISDDGTHRPELISEHSFSFDDDLLSPEEFQSGSTFSSPNTTYPRGLTTPTPYLEALTLDHINFTYLGYWLFSPSQSPPISFRHLRELRISHSADPLVVEKILSCAGSSLEYLHLKPGFWDVYTFDLRKNENLKSLRLTLEEPSTALMWCTTLLASLLPLDGSGSIAQELTYISLEFWPKLTSSSFSASASTSTSTSFHNSPDGSPHHISVSSSPSSSLSASSIASSSSLLSSASSPFHGSSLISSSASSASSSYTSSSPSSSPNSTFPSTPSRSRSPSPRLSSASPTTPSSSSLSSYQRRRLSHSQPTWSYLSSILSSILLPSANDTSNHQQSSKKKKQVDIGLFAPSSSPEFIRVKELMLSGIAVDCGLVDDNNNSSGSGLPGSFQGSKGIKDSVDNHEHVTDDLFYGKGKGKGKEIGEFGVVRVYQLGLKSQRSVGRICGPMLRSFESACH